MSMLPLRVPRKYVVCYDKGTQNQQYVTKYTSTLTIEAFLLLIKILNKRPFKNRFRYGDKRKRPRGMIDPVRPFGLITEGRGITWLTPKYDRLICVDWSKKKSLYYRKRQWNVVR